MAVFLPKALNTLKTHIKLWKSKLRCETLEEFADRIRKMMFKDEKSK